MKKTIGVVHVIAECKDCDWRTESYKNGQAIAAKHAKKYEHVVIVDVGLVVEYDGKGV
jgi:hypothetical protein